MDEDVRVYAKSADALRSLIERVVKMNRKRERNKIIYL